MLLKVMPLENQEPCTFKTLRTPNVAERSCVLYVPEKYFKDTTNTAAGTTLKDFLPGVDKADALNRGFGLYLLTETEEAPAGYQAFTFAKPKTAKQQRVPFKTRTYHEPHYWPDWMRAMYAIEDATVPYEIATATGSQYVDRVLDRVEIIDGGNYETSITVEEHFNAPPTPEIVFPLKKFAGWFVARTIVGGSVAWGLKQTEVSKVTAAASSNSVVQSMVPLRQKNDIQPNDIHIPAGTTPTGVLPGVLSAAETNAVKWTGLVKVRDKFNIALSDGRILERPWIQERDDRLLVLGVGWVERSTEKPVGGYSPEPFPAIEGAPAGSWRRTIRVVSE